MYICYTKHLIICIDLKILFLSYKHLRARYGFPMILHGKSVKDKGANEIIFTILNLRRGHSTLISNIKIIVSALCIFHGSKTNFLNFGIFKAIACFV